MNANDTVERYAEKQGGLHRITRRGVVRRSTVYFRTQTHTQRRFVAVQIRSGGDLLNHHHG